MPIESVSDKSELILIDGMAVLYRAYYAVRELSTTAGKPTNALFGFIRMLKQIDAVWRPTHHAVVFDGGLPEARIALLKDYKAQRPSMPDALREQINLVEEYLKLMRIASFRVERQEADDLIATVASGSESEFDMIFIATSDKDMYQLINEKVKIIPVSGKGGVMDSEAVFNKTGVYPHQIVDWLSLVGDTSDNIPGVPGVGPKTAAKLLVQYGSLENIFNNIDKLENDKLKTKLKDNKDIAERNTNIIYLKRDINYMFELSDMEVCRPDLTGLLSFFEEMEFKSMVKEIREPELF